MADTDGVIPVYMSDSEGAIPPDMSWTDGTIMAIRCTTAAITAAQDGTGAEATIEGAGTGTSYDQSCQGIERNSPHTKGRLKSLLLIRTPAIVEHEELVVPNLFNFSYEPFAGGGGTAQVCSQRGQMRTDSIAGLTRPLSAILFPGRSLP